MTDDTSRPKIIQFYAKVGAPEAIFFVSLLALFFIPFIGGIEDVLLNSILHTFFILSLYYLIYSSGLEKVRLFKLILLVSLIFTWVGHFSFITIPQELRSIVEILVMFISFYFIYRSIFASSRIDFNTLIAAVSGYMLIGISLGISVYIFQLLAPGSFSFPKEVSLRDAQYFSFVTMSTLGYGDILPITNNAKGFAILITLIGQFYMAIVVGLILGKLLTRQNS
jgi:hypothetical protein